MKKGLKILFCFVLLSFLVGCAYASDENSTEIIEVQDEELIESINFNIIVQEFSGFFKPGDELHF